jgi:MYXO-CTERM domain-containing protein
MPAARLPAAKRMAAAVRHDDTVERAFELAAADPARLDDLLGALRHGWLWVPLPGDGAPVTDGSAVHLPTVRYLGDVFIPAFTSAARLLGAAAPQARAGQPAPVVPHVAVRAADLARQMPAGLGIALNPGSPRSIPVSPAGVGELAAVQATVGGCQVTVGPPPDAPRALLAAIAAGLRDTVPAAREAATAWLTVRAGAGQPGDRGGAGMIISVGLDDPAAEAARDAVIAVVEGAVAATDRTGWPVDVTFPGEGEPDVIDRWVATACAPFYQRDLRAGLPAPRRPPA